MKNLGREDKVVVIGAGEAAHQFVLALRTEGFEGGIHVYGDEPYLPYQRPPLSKKFLDGGISPESLQLALQDDVYTNARVAFHLGQSVEAIDTAERTVSVAGVDVTYDHLVLATGSRCRELPFGTGLDGVMTVRNIADTNRLRDAAVGARQAVVVGGGFIGLEIASVLGDHGIKTTVLEGADRLVGRVVSPILSSDILRRHTERGVRIELEAGVVDIVETDGALRVELSTGAALDADFVVVGIGAVANDDLAVAAGIASDNGIIVDEFLATAVPEISAIGDCARVSVDGGWVRFESVQSADDQARYLARRLMGAVADSYSVTPWFWSDQAGVKLQIAGRATGERTVMKGSVGDDRFSLWCFDGDEFVGGETVSLATHHLAMRRLLDKRLPLSPEMLEDHSFDVITYSKR